MIWGDVNKNIGYQAVGISPIRPNWSGLVPVPGDGRYEWDGYLPITALPHVHNPARGYWATANNYQAPDRYPYPTALHYTWGDEMRGLRVDELLSSGRRFTIVDMMQFQHDELSIPARNLTPLLAAIEFTDPRSKDAAERLLHWDYVLDKQSISAAIYVTFERKLLENVRQLVVPEAARSILTRLNKKRVIDWLVVPDGRFGEQPIAGRDEILQRSLSQAVQELTERFGPSPTDWRYGQEKFKHVQIRHPLSAAVDEETRAKLDVGPAPRGGYDSTLNNTSSSDNQDLGSDVSGDHGRGRLGQFRGYQRSLVSRVIRTVPTIGIRSALWAKHQYFPLFFSREKIESVTESRAVLQPRTTTRAAD